MVKAAALYIVIIIALLIGMISVSLLTIAYYYRAESQKKARTDRLCSSLESARALLLSGDYLAYDAELSKDLYGDGKDSVVLQKSGWGVYTLNTAKAFELADTLKSAFLSGISFTDPAAIYLADEDRPLSVSGNTQITGDGELPKAGLKQSYVDGKPYAGKELIRGAIRNSTRDLPPLNEKWIKTLLDNFKRKDTLAFAVKDSLNNSFFNPALVLKMGLADTVLSGLAIKGKVILISDTVVYIKAGAVLEDVQIYAPSIVVSEGFKGSCQLFARDSVVVGKGCTFLYPSFIGVFKPDGGRIQAKISLAAGTRFSGLLLSYEQKRSDLQTLISLAKDCLVKGEVYATGYIKLEKQVQVYGKVYAKRFIMQTPATLYENYLIDLLLNRKLLSKYYLSSPLFKRKLADQNVLKWLN
ncbi:hypothetical protein LPB86_03900 [Pedobacter sp. MC2016-14]|uniref:hypothetical protein n=1 Tax=Pedobacter sp. MC2016-14 TaxID=2897327 RepID=UPI001E35F088|nr:hypothetical protein [Pedobacter sp. MC2016-14]MCD0487358.1 hypothetical protein [Pedobacter sp. MC2016-14]